MTARELSDRLGWKGSAAGKTARHRRVSVRRGKASTHPCARCSEYGVGRQAREWAQIHETDGNDPWADFVPLCRRCHFRYDGLRLGGVTAGSGSAANASNLSPRPGEQHPRHKLSDDAVRDIRQRLANRERQADIASSHGVSRSAVSAIATGRTWHHHLLGVPVILAALTLLTVCLTSTQPAVASVSRASAATATAEPAFVKAVLSPPAAGRPASVALPRRLRMMRWIVPRTSGCPYVWAGAGPCADGYDCSGLVMTAWAHVGVSLPHNAEAMIESGKLVQIPFRDAKRGDIATFGWPAYHVVLVAYAHNGVVKWIYGAQSNHVGYYSTAYFAPTAVWRVR